MRETRILWIVLSGALAAILIVILPPPSCTASEDHDTVANLLGSCRAAKTDLAEIMGIVEGGSGDLSRETASLLTNVSDASDIVAMAEGPPELAERKHSRKLRRKLRRARKLAQRVVRRVQRQRNVRKLARKVERRVDFVLAAAEALTVVYPSPPVDPPPDDPPPDPPPADVTAEMWEHEEWSLPNSTWSGNPFDLVATVTFTHEETGRTRKTEMFYAGDDVWMFRFTGTLEGDWTWQSASTDANLDGHGGTIEVVAQPDPEVKGFLTSSGDKFAIMVDDENDLQGFSYFSYEGPI
ncbi:MAG: DUF5060 domain-containing protein, partial [Planctomycetota bacterium]